MEVYNNKMNLKTTITIIDSNGEYTQFNSKNCVYMYFFNKYKYLSPPLDTIITNLPKFLWNVVKEDQIITKYLRHQYGLQNE